VYKLIKAAFPDYLFRLIKSYLTERTFFVSCNGTTSATLPITAGVPQSSVLGSLLFNFYSADLPTSPSTNLATFADDKALFSSHRNHRYAHLQAQRHLDLLQQWLTKWRIKINTDKTAVVYFTRRRPRDLRQLSFFNEPLTIQTTARYLGIDLDRRFTFASHLQSAAKRATQRTMALYPMLKSPALSIELKLRIYAMMIRPILTYAAPAWQHAAPTNLKKLQIVQNLAARIISGHSKDTRIIQIHEDLNLELLSDFIARTTRSFWHRISITQHAPLHVIGTLLP